jgi:uncharacterized protein (UPF0248 family)
MKFNSLVVSTFLVSNVRLARSLRYLSLAATTCWCKPKREKLSSRCRNCITTMQGILPFFGKFRHEYRFLATTTPFNKQLCQFSSPFYNTGTSSRLYSVGYEDFENLSMENLFEEWTLQDDQLLYENRSKSRIELASMLGRGLRGVESRLEKLMNVDSQAYKRLFVERGYVRQGKDETSIRDRNGGTTEKLVPAIEILNRIRWDATLSKNDFSIMHYDRVNGEIVETSMIAPNDTISGKASFFVDALPEHRVVAIKYKERIVWDRKNRIDLFHAKEFDGIKSIIASYERGNENMMLRPG